MGEHLPVLIDEIVEMARSMSRPLHRFFDGTFGRGGYTARLLESFPDARGLAVDRDEEAIRYGSKIFSSWMESGRLQLRQANFSDNFSKEGLFDFIVLDLGVSSPQLDRPERGFSFYGDGPLDMRMDQRQPLTAAEIVNTWAPEQLHEIFQELGEIRRPQRVVRAIVEDRRQKNFQTTRDLAGLIERIEGWGRKGQHPATRYFMALRIAVNEELHHLERGLLSLSQGLEEGGRLAAVTFHSLEDRIVKQVFKNLPGRRVNKKVIRPSREEMRKNPRARSAKLRVFERSAT